MSDPHPNASPGDSPWWESFFADAWLDIHDALRTRRQTEAECDFLDEVLQLDGSSRVLDIPCGNGRHSLELAARGCHVTGVDLSRPMLDVARQRAKALGLPLELLHSDMRAIDFECRFDAAINFWGSFGYFDAKGDQALVRAVACALRPAGRFLIDTQVFECILRNFQRRAWHTIGEMTLLEDRHYDVLAGRMETEWTVIFENGDKKTMRSSIRLYSLPELRVLLRSAGFAHFKAMSSLGGAEFEVGAPRLYLLATKA
jgi:SAM-dependent methyltransferase